MVGQEKIRERSIVLDDLAATERFGRMLGEVALGGDILCLDGELGAGKTTLVQAIAQGLEIGGEYYVTSPSFAILHEYPGRIPLYHMDFYRLQGSGDVIDLGFEEYFYGYGLTVIEWAERAREILPEERLSLRLQGHDLERRLVAISGGGGYWQRVIARLGGLQP